MIRIRQVKIGIEEEQKLPKKIAKILNVNINDIKNIIINKKSLDARKKDGLFYVYEVDVDIQQEEKVLSKSNSKDVFKTPKEQY